MFRLPFFSVRKKLVWFTVLIHILCPLTIAFTPLMLARADKPQYLSAVSVRTLTLGAGENVQDVAKRYNLSLSELKEINKFRIFSRPFEQLSAGDDIDVPVNKSMQEKPSTPPDAEQTEAVERWLASGGSDLGTSLSGRNHSTLSDFAKNRVRSTALSASQAAVDAWLNQFGTAKIQLGVADDLSLSDSSLDMLFSLYDSPNFLWFIQTGGRYAGQRTTLNAGTGLRYFKGNWMYGVNTFFDNDITGHNRRLGFGAELWTDYLRFSGNVYSGLTDWHASRDIEDYDERPADGFDISASGWLPAYPQLGGKVKYEQYYGNEVALVSRDSRQQNPRAISTGIEYTPVPLVTLSSEYRVSGGKDEMQFNLQFRWMPGVSLASQLSPDAVAAGRILAGSRLELVERNNNIVLDYKKREVIKLVLPDIVHGVEGSTQALGVSVTSKYGLDRIDWLLPDGFVAAGGALKEPSKGVWQMTLPVWQVKDTNVYEITGVAWDQKGNASRPVRMKVSVERKHIDTSRSVLHLESSQYFAADGKTSQKIILKALDENGAPVIGLASLIHFKGAFVPSSRQAGAGGTTAMLTRFAQALGEFILPSALADTTLTGEWGGVHISDFTESAPGIYEANLTSGMTPGELQLTLTVNDTEMPPLKVTFGEVVYHLDNPRVITQSPLADGVTAPEVLVTVITDDGKPVVNNEVVNIYVGELPQKVTADQQGDVRVKLPPQTVAGEHSFDIHSGGSHVTVSVTFSPVVSLYSNSVLGADVTGILADGKDKATIKLTLNDGAGNPLPGLPVVFSVTPSDGVSLSPVTDHGDGAYSVGLRGTVSGHVRVSAKVANVSVPINPVDITLEQRVLRIFKNGAPLQGDPVVGDRLVIDVQCGGGGAGQACAGSTVWHWEAAESGSDVWSRIPGATSDEYVVTSDMQRRRLRVSDDK